MSDSPLIYEQLQLMTSELRSLQSIVLSQGVRLASLEDQLKTAAAGGSPVPPPSMLNGATSAAAKAKEDADAKARALGTEPRLLSRR